MNKPLLIVFSVLLLSHQLKSQEIDIQSNITNNGIEMVGNNNTDIHINQAGESAPSGSKTCLVAEPGIQNLPDSGSGINNIDPVIIVDPLTLIQYGNYLGTCAPEMKYNIHASNLTGNLVIWDNNPGIGKGYISLTGQNDYVRNLTIYPVNGFVDTTVFVRFCPDFYDDHTYITNSSSGIDVNVLVEVIPVAGNAPVTTLGKVEAEPGTIVRIPVTAKDFEYMFEIQYVIEFDPTVLSFIDLESYFIWWAWASVVPITPELSQLVIEIGCPSDVYMSAPDNEKIFDLVFNYISGSSSLEFGECSFTNIYNLQPNDEPASEFYHQGSIGSSVKTTTVNLNFEGLFNPDLGKMNQAMGESEPRFSAEVADQFTIRLSSEVPSYSTVFELDSVEVDQDGHCQFKVPSMYSGNYYLSVSHRNSIETWSAIPISFNDSVVNYNFTTSANKAFGNNMKHFGDKYCFYGGDVNQDGTIDTEDMTPVENNASVYTFGYVPGDVNGDGIVDTWDMAFIDDNSTGFVEKKFPSAELLPLLSTDSVTDISVTSAICHGSILIQGGSQVTIRGVCWDTIPEPTIACFHTNETGGLGNFESNLTGLEPNTFYYYRAFATNNEGTAYGNEMSFNSAIFSPGIGVTDFEGNQYSTVVIGYQEWMAENLKAIYYNNGDPIPNVVDNAQWNNLNTGAYCWYNNDEVTYGEVYGALYNWYTVNDNRGLCPSGWHIPTDADWAGLLTNYLGGLYVAGNKIKATYGWNNNNNGSNLSGFNGLPGGLRYKTLYNSFRYNGVVAGWWSAEEQTIETAMYHYLGQSSFVGPYSNWKNNGYSIRCLKDSVDK